MDGGRWTVGGKIKKSVRPRRCMALTRLVMERRDLAVEHCLLLNARLPGQGKNSTKHPAVGGSAKRFYGRCMRGGEGRGGGRGGGGDLSHVISGGRVSGKE